jgi:hypothetical protein
MSFSAEAYYEHGHGEAPVIVRTDADVDALVDALLAQPPSNSVATLYIIERPHNTAGFPDHELGIGVYAVGGVGGVWYYNPGGNWYTLGAHSDRDEVYYFYMGNDRSFPIDSEIPIDLIRQTAKEFLASGGERPACVRWQPFPIDVAAPTS